MDSRSTRGGPTIATISELQQEIYNDAVEHGWWDEPRSFGDIIALIHSELSEALEEYRNGMPEFYEGKDGKPEGITVEMADVIIRILDWAESQNVSIQTALRVKMDFNKTRPYRHGGKLL